MAKPLKLPTKEELSQLDRWALVAYASRCAMRVQPLVGADSFGDLELSVVKKHLESIDIAITISAGSFAADAATYRAATYRAAAAAAAAADADADAADYASRAVASAAAAIEAAAAAADEGFREVFIQSALSDYDFLVNAKPKDKADPAIHETSLWKTDKTGNPVPQGWDEVLDSWEAWLKPLGKKFAAIATRHRGMIEGQGINWVEAEKRIVNWVDRQKKEKSEDKKQSGEPDTQTITLDPIQETSEAMPMAITGGEPQSESGKTHKVKVDSKIKIGEPIDEDHDVSDDDSDKTNLIDSVPTHSDEPALVDQLGRRAFARALAERIRNTYETDYEGAFLINLHGPWGSGKSSLLNFIKNELTGTGDGFWSHASKEHWIVIEFNAWEQQNSGPAWWALMDAVYQQALTQFRFVRPIRAIWLFMREKLWRFCVRWGYLLIALAVVIWIAIGVMWWIPKEKIAENIKIISTSLGAAVTVGGIVFAITRTLFAGSAHAAHSFSEASNNPTKKIRRHFLSLIKMIRTPVMVMIDDLDRCREEYVIELLESVQTLFRQGKVTYLVAADRRWLCTSYENQYESYGSSLGEPGRPLGYLFLEKIFQLSATVPPISPAVKERYWKQLVRVDEESNRLQRENLLKELAKAEAALKDIKDEREILHRVQSFKSESVEGQAYRQAAVVRLAKPEVEQRTEHALLPFAPLLDSNPRSMKRLVNAYGIQRAVSLLAGIDVPPGELALWTILSLRWPLLAERLQRKPSLIEYFIDREKLREAEENEELLQPLSDLKVLLYDKHVRRVIEGDAEGVEASLTRKALETILLIRSDGESATSDGESAPSVA